MLFFEDRLDFLLRTKDGVTNGRRNYMEGEINALEWALPILRNAADASHLKEMAAREKARERRSMGAQLAKEYLSK